MIILEHGRLRENFSLKNSLYLEFSPWEVYHNQNLEVPRGFIHPMILGCERGFA